jgi:hypothetical protein
MLRAVVARVLIVTVSSTIVPRAEAALIATDAAINADRERILTLLDRPEVAAQLEAYGVHMDDAKARIDALTDAEAAQLSAEIDKAFAGGRADPLSLMVLAVVAVILLPFILLGALVYCGLTKAACKGGSGEYDASRIHKP